MSDPTPDDQASAVEWALSNYLGHVETLKKLVMERDPRKRRPMHELEMFQRRIPALQRAAVTLRKAAEKHAASVANLKKSEEVVKVAAPPLASEPTPQPATEQAVLDL